MPAHDCETMNKKGPRAIFLVLVVGGVLLLLVFLSGNRNDSPPTSPVIRARAEINATLSALAIYRSRCGRLPTTEQGLEALVSKPRLDPIPRNWGQQMKTSPIDPWGYSYVYETIQVDNFYLLTLKSGGPDGRIGTKDDIGVEQTICLARTDNSDLHSHDFPRDSN